MHDLSKGTSEITSAVTTLSEITSQMKLLLKHLLPCKVESLLDINILLIL
jgi:hypothetical protein